MEIFFAILAGPIGILVVIILLASIRQVNQYERGVKFMMGRYHKLVEPGWRIVVPVFQSMTKVDMRVKAVDVPLQEGISKDNVSAKVNAVIYYKIVDPVAAILQVESFMYAVNQLAQTTMRNVIGQLELDELLANREAAAQNIKDIIDETTRAWGVDVAGVELKDIVLPDDMQRVIARQAEAERERRAVVIQSSGEVSAAENLAKAAHMLSASPGALHLRTLSTISDVSSDQSNTIIFALPVEVLRAFDSINKK